MTKPIAALDPGTAFRLACSGRPGVLLAVNPGSATVRYTHEEPKHVDLGNGREFNAMTSSRPTTIALSTMVEV